jgi:hypothetical protein
MKLLEWFTDWFCARRRMERVDDSRQIEETQAVIREAEVHRDELDRKISDELRALSAYEQNSLDLIRRRAEIRNRFRDRNPHHHGDPDVRNGGHAAGGAT